MSRAYGWTDETIYNLTLPRFQQAVAAIDRDNYIENRRRWSISSWQTRTLASYIAMGFMVEENKENDALNMAQTLGFDEIEIMQLEEGLELQEQSQQEAPKAEPKPGSFERFMGSMASPSRWK